MAPGYGRPAVSGPGRVQPAAGAGRL